MLDLSKPGVIKDILGRHGFTFSKGLGQNFLINPSVCPRMAEMGGAAPGVGVLEIGPGIGVLTRELAQRADKVVSIEVDHRLLPVLAETLDDLDNVSVIHGDVLKVDLFAILEEHFSGMEVVVCANLPYYITSPILMNLLESRLPVEAITVMVQKEAAARILARPGTRETGSISVATWYYSEPKLLFQVSRGSFLPPPNVDSSVIRLDVRKAPAVSVGDEALFFRVVRGAFGQRRKTLGNSLSSALGLPKDKLNETFAACNIPPNARAEQLSLEQFAALANALS